jgi:phosphoadenosine phosphosulfate reductase
MPSSSSSTNAPDAAPAIPATVNVDHLDRLVSPLDGEMLLRQIIRHAFPGRTVVTTSFGAESAVLLALVAKVDPTTPVVFLGTGYLSPRP